MAPTTAASRACASGALRGVRYGGGISALTGRRGRVYGIQRPGLGRRTPQSSARRCPSAQLNHLPAIELMMLSNPMMRMPQSSPRSTIKLLAPLSHWPLASPAPNVYRGPQLHPCRLPSPASPSPSSAPPFALARPAPPLPPGMVRGPQFHRCRHPRPTYPSPSSAPFLPLPPPLLPGMVRCPQLQHRVLQCAAE